MQENTVLNYSGVKFALSVLALVLQHFIWNSLFADLRTDDACRRLREISTIIIVIDSNASPLKMLIT